MLVSFKSNFSKITIHIVYGFSSAVNLYLNSLAKHKLYYENYQMVSVMFAMLINFPMNLASLRVLNEIITEFDRLVS